MTKYRAIKTEIDGIKFDSKAEAEYYAQLLSLQKSGAIRDIELQPRIVLTASKILYKPDFKLTYPDGRVEYVDVKGFSTPVFNIKKRLWKNYGAGTLVIVKKKGRSFIETARIEALDLK